MEVALEVGMADLDLEGAVADRVGMAEERGEVVVAEMEVEARRIGADTVTAAAEQAMERQVDLLGGKVPQRHLDRLVEGQAEAALVAAARAVDAMDEGDRRLALEAGPHLARRRRARSRPRAGSGWKRRCDEAEAAPALLVDQLQRRDIDRRRCGPGCRRSPGRGRTGSG